MSLRMGENQTFNIEVRVLKDIFPEDEDFFEGIFEDWTIKSLMIIFHLISLGSVGGLMLILWFERSGRAGQYRTLVNQLASFNIEQVSVKISFFF